MLEQLFRGRFAMRNVVMVMLFVSTLTCGFCGEDEEKPKPKPPAVKITKGTQTDYGPFLSCSVKAPAPAGKKGPVDTSVKGIAIKVGKNGEATVCFDADLMRVSAGWTG